MERKLEVKGDIVQGNDLDAKIAALEMDLYARQRIIMSGLLPEVEARKIDAEIKELELRLSELKAWK